MSSQTSAALPTGGSPSTRPRPQLPRRASAESLSSIDDDPIDAANTHVRAAQEAWVEGGTASGGGSGLFSRRDVTPPPPMAARAADTTSDRVALAFGPESITGSPAAGTTPANMAAAAASATNPPVNPPPQSNHHQPAVGTTPSTTPPHQAVAGSSPQAGQCYARLTIPSTAHVGQHELLVALKTFGALSLRLDAPSRSTTVRVGSHGAQLGHPDAGGAPMLTSAVVQFASTAAAKHAARAITSGSLLAAFPGAQLSVLSRQSAAALMNRSSPASQPPSGNSTLNTTADHLAFQHLHQQQQPPLSAEASFSALSPGSSGVAARNAGPGSAAASPHRQPNPNAARWTPPPPPQGGQQPQQQSTQPHQWSPQHRYADPTSVPSELSTPERAPRPTRGETVAGLTENVVLDPRVREVDVAQQLATTFSTYEKGAEEAAALLVGALRADVSDAAVARIATIIATVPPTTAFFLPLATGVACAFTSLAQHAETHALAVASGEILGRLFAVGFFTEDPFLYISQLLRGDSVCERPQAVEALARLAQCLPRPAAAIVGPPASTVASATQLARTHLAPRVRRAAARLANQLADASGSALSLRGTFLHVPRPRDAKPVRRRITQSDGAAIRQRTVFVAHVPSYTKRGALAEWLEQFGTYDRVRVNSVRGGTAVHIFVEFASSLGAVRAVQMTTPSPHGGSGHDAGTHGGSSVGLPPPRAQLGVASPAKAPISDDERWCDAIYAKGGSLHADAPGSHSYDASLAQDETSMLLSPTYPTGCSDSLRHSHPPAGSDAATGGTRPPGGGRRMLCMLPCAFGLVDADNPLVVALGGGACGASPRIASGSSTSHTAASATEAHGHMVSPSNAGRKHQRRRADHQQQPHHQSAAGTA